MCLSGCLPVFSHLRSYSVPSQGQQLHTVPGAAPQRGVFCFALRASSSASASCKNPEQDGLDPLLCLCQTGIAQFLTNTRGCYAKGNSSPNWRHVIGPPARWLSAFVLKNQPSTATHQARPWRFEFDASRASARTVTPQSRPQASPQKPTAEGKIKK